MNKLYSGGGWQLFTFGLILCRILGLIFFPTVALAGDVPAPCNPTQASNTFTTNLGDVPGPAGGASQGFFIPLGNGTAFTVTGIYANIDDDNTLGGAQDVTLAIFNATSQGLPTGSPLVASVRSTATFPGSGSFESVGCSGGNPVNEFWPFTPPLLLAPNANYTFMVTPTNSNASDLFHGSTVNPYTLGLASTGNPTFMALNGGFNDYFFSVVGSQATLTTMTSDALTILQNHGVDKDSAVLILFLVSVLITFGFMGRAHAPPVAFVAAFGFWGLFWLVSTLSTPLALFFIALVVILGVIGSIILLKNKGDTSND